MASVYRAYVLSGGEVADLVTAFSQLVRDEQAWIEATLRDDERLRPWAPKSSEEDLIE